MFDLRCSMLDARCSTFDVRASCFVPRCLCGVTDPQNGTRAQQHPLLSFAGAWFSFSPSGMYTSVLASSFSRPRAAASRNAASTLSAVFADVSWYGMRAPLDAHHWRAIAFVSTGALGTLRISSFLRGMQGAQKSAAEAAYLRHPSRALEIYFIPNDDKRKVARIFREKQDR
eukprot:scaffold407_cov251-Pinguiococcus_pyrenoidosus.AAC.41